MRVVVPALERDCAAHRALATEGVEHEVVLMAGDRDYSRLLTSLWADGEGFTIVEHDVVPFPGAISGLEDCDQPWCVHWFPFAKNAIRPALGCIHFSTELVSGNPHIDRHWGDSVWNELDGKVYPAITALCGSPHRHHPDVAHLKRQGR